VTNLFFYGIPPLTIRRRPFGAQKDRAFFFQEPCVGQISILIPSRSPFPEASSNIVVRLFSSLVEDDSLFLSLLAERDSFIRAWGHSLSEAPPASPLFFSKRSELLDFKVDESSPPYFFASSSSQQTEPCSFILSLYTVTGFFSWLVTPGKPPESFCLPNFGPDFTLFGSCPLGGPFFFILRLPLVFLK